MFSLLLCAYLVAAPVAEEIASAKAAEEELDYQRAKKLLDGLLSRSDLLAAERLEVLFLAGVVARTLGNNDDARAHFIALFEKNIDYPAPKATAPKVTTFYEVVRDEVRDQQAKAATPPDIVEQTPPPPSEGPPITAIVAGSGAALFVVGGVAGVVGEAMFADASAPFEGRSTGRTLALFGWAGATVGALVAVSSGAMFLVAASE